MAESYELGKIGEDLAVAYLKKQGYKILEQRWHDHHMEIDIIAFDEETRELVSIEVKTRETNVFGCPEDAVDTKKIRRTVSATDFYMKSHNVLFPVRFDIFAIIIPQRGEAQITHFKDAFYAPIG